LKSLKTHEIALLIISADDISVSSFIKEFTRHSQMGPFDRMPVTKQFSVFQHYYFLIFSIITILIRYFLQTIQQKRKEN